MATLPYYELEELAALLGYANARAIKRRIKQGTFEIPTYQLAGRRVANVSVVKKFFADRDAPIAPDPGMDTSFLDD
jgi:hypothetical protein